MTFIDWLCLAILIAALYLAYKQKTGSLNYRYKDVIVSRWQDADFYLGKPGGTEFEYKEGNPNCTWSRIVKRDGWKCWKCGRKVVPKDNAVNFLGLYEKREVHVDHKIAFILGGKGDSIEDGLTACYKCNIRRSAKIDETCLKRVRELGKKIYIGKNVPKYKSTRKKR